MRYKIKSSSTLETSISHHGLIKLLVKGKGLDKIIEDSNCDSLGLHLVLNQSALEELQEEQNKEKIYNMYVESLWYGDIVYFLLYLQYPPSLNKRECQSLKLKYMK